MIEAVIFDLDGVVIDSEPLHFEAEKEILGRRGVRLRVEDVSGIIGRKELEGITILKEKYGLKEDTKTLYAEKQQVFLSLVEQKMKPRLGLLELLDLLQRSGKVLAVASSAPRNYVELVLRGFGIKKRFKAIVCGGDVTKGKPSPDIFLLAAEKIGVDPERCLVVEDAETGVTAAKRAGMRCIAVPHKFTEKQNFSSADTIVRSLKQIDLELLNQLG